MYLNLTSAADAISSQVISIFYSPRATGTSMDADAEGKCEAGMDMRERVSQLNGPALRRRP